jgi:hypothetical protein
VTVIGTSRGTLRAAEGIARGARPDALVLTSGFLSPESGSSSNVMSILGSPSALPRTLVIHHSSDGCRFTLPAGVDAFIKWAGGRARVKWLSGGAEEGDPCQPRGHHGFNGLDGQVVSPPCRIPRSAMNSTGGIAMFTCPMPSGVSAGAERGASGASAIPQCIGRCISSTMSPRCNALSAVRR